MPQLDFSTYFTQFFWVIITFLSFWFVMDRFIISKISQNIEERKRKYDDLIIKAQKVNQKAKDSLNKYEEAIAAAKLSATEKIKQNEEELKIILSQKEEEIDKKLKEKIKESEENLDKELNKTLSKVDSLAEQTAINILTRLDINNISVEDIKKVSQNRA